VIKGDWSRGGLFGKLEKNSKRNTMPGRPKIVNGGNWVGLVKILGGGLGESHEKTWNWGGHQDQKKENRSRGRLPFLSQKNEEGNQGDKRKDCDPDSPNVNSYPYISSLRNRKKTPRVEEKKKKPHETTAAVSENSRTGKKS